MKMRHIAAAAAACCICAASAAVPVGAATGDSWKEAYHNTLNSYQSAKWALYDIDNNGTPELFVETEPGDNSEINVFTYSDDNVKKIGEEFAAAIYGNQATGEILFGYFSLMARTNGSIVYQFNGTALTKTLSFAKTGEDEATLEYSVNDTPVGYEEYSQYESRYNSESLTEINFDRQAFWQETETALEPWKTAYIEFLEEAAKDIEPQDKTNYSLIDFNQDGIPEIVAAYKDEESFDDDYDQPAVYTYKNGEVVEANEEKSEDDFGGKQGWWSIYSPSLCANEQYGYYYADYEGMWIFFKFDGTNLVLTDVFTCFGENEYIHNGYDVSKADYEAALKKYDPVIKGGFEVQYENAIGDIMPVVNYQPKTNQTQPTDPDDNNQNNTDNNQNNQNTNNTNNTSNQTNNTAADAPKTGDAGTGAALAVLLTAAGAAFLAQKKRR